MSVTAGRDPSDAEKFDALVKRIRAVDPLLGRSDARDLIEATVPRPKDRTILLGHFDEFPDLLTSGDPHIPPVAQRLIARLIDAGCPLVVRPHCALCDRPRYLNRLLDDAAAPAIHAYRPALQAGSVMPVRSTRWSRASVPWIRSWVETTCATSSRPRCRR